MKFTFGPIELVFIEGASYPSQKEIEKFQVSERTAAGILQTEELGITLRRRILVFENMNKTDHDAIENWFDVVVNGAQYEFDFEDERGFTGAVKFVESTFKSDEVDFELFNLTLTVEYQ